MLHVLDHTPFAHMLACMHALSISRVLDLLACTYVQLSIIKNESSPILQAKYQPANTMHSQCQAKRNRRSSSMVAHPTCSLTSHTSIYNSIRLRAWLSLWLFAIITISIWLIYVICNYLTTHSEPDLWYIIYTIK